MRNRPQNQPFFMWFAALDAHRVWGENAYSGTHNPDELEVPFYLADAPGASSLQHRRMFLWPHDPGKSCTICARIHCS